MLRTPLSLAIATAIAVSMALPAFAQQVPVLTPTTLIGRVGTYVTPEETAGMHDMTARFTYNFPIAVQVLHLSVDLDVRGELWPADALYYIEGGVLQRVKIFIWPRDGSKFWDAAPRDQRIWFDRLAMLMYEASDAAGIVRPMSAEIVDFTSWSDLSLRHYYLSLWKGNQLSLEISAAGFNERLAGADVMFDPGRWEGYP